MNEQMGYAEMRRRLFKEPPFKDGYMAGQAYLADCIREDIENGDYSGDTMERIIKRLKNVDRAVECANASKIIEEA